MIRTSILMLADIFGRQKRQTDETEFIVPRDRKTNSTEGQTIVVAPRTQGKKIVQRKRIVNEKLFR